MGSALAVAMTLAPAIAQHRPGFGGPGGPGGPMGGGPMGGDPTQRLSHLATLLDLTDAQKTAAKAIFDSAKTQADPVATQMREAHQAVQAAVKDNKSDSEIDALTARAGTLTGQLTAINAKAQRAFRQLLTQQQRDKVDAIHSGMGNRFGRP
jgi:Spy/CpxP family protein refolding chaperone